MKTTQTVPLVKVVLDQGIGLDDILKQLKPGDAFININLGSNTAEIPQVLYDRITAGVGTRLSNKPGLSEGAD